MANEIPARQRLVVPFDGHVIGEGFNSDTFERVGTGLDVTTTQEDPIADGQVAQFKFSMVTSQRSFEKALNINVEVDARYGLFSGGAKFGFAESSAVNSSSTYIVASCSVMNALRYGSNFMPRREAEPLIAAGDRNGFKQAFGDRFTQALRTGGEFHALVRVTSSNTEHQRKISASLHAELNGLVAGGGFSASLEDAETDRTSTTEVDIQIHQTGGQGNQIRIPPSDADKIRQHMNTFAASVHDNAKAFEAEVLSYDALALRFPPLTEIEDKRRVLENCQDIKRRYWTALSDLSFLKSENAPFIFESIPPEHVLTDLENEFRRVLNSLMAHARQVSAGVIEPVLFVPEDEPVVPRFRRRNATRFAVWWARRNEPGLLPDEKQLIGRIAGTAAPFLSTPVDQAAPADIERASQQITSLDLSVTGLRSLAALPKMLEAPVEQLTASNNNLETLNGLEDFTRLESLVVEAAGLDNIHALSNLAGLRVLQLSRNRISDLSPIRGLTSLETLMLGQNNIRSLDALSGLRSLKILALSQGLLQFTQDGQPPPPFVLLDNPIDDATALRDLPLLSNPFVTTERLSVRRFALSSGELVDEGVAVRIGRSNRFRFRTNAGREDTLLVMACFRIDDIRATDGPFVAVALHFPTAKTSGLAFTKPNQSRELLPAAELRRSLTAPDGSARWIGFSIGLVAGIDPQFAIEATAQ